MNLLLRLLEPRSVVLIALALAAIWAGGRWGSQAHHRAEMMLHPPADAVSPLSADILKDTEAREAARLRGLHRIVSGEIAASAAKGFSVDAYQRLADAALAEGASGSRAAAVERLNRLRLTIPRKPEAFRVAVAGDLNPDRFESPPQKAKAAKR